MDITRGLHRISEFPETRLEINGIKRRSSVAIILRINRQVTSTRILGKPREEGVAQYLREVGAITESDLEILFIKRASSERDRWSSHIALPGGRCERDESDLEAAVREAYEEVGLDLNRDGLYVGPLDQRPLKVEWGTKTIMVLCPFVFLLTNNDAKLTLQTSEVATAFWYPYSQLVDTSKKSAEIVAVGHRLNLDNTYIPRFLHPVIKSMAGTLGFPAIDLYPTKLLHDMSSSSASPLPLAPPPYKLWGVTFNVLTDFFAVMSPDKVSSATIFPPTLQLWDMKFMQHLVTKNFLAARRKIIDSKLQVGAGPESMDLVNCLNDDLAPYIRKAIALTMTGRLALAVAALYILCRRR